jgi:ankyrin repeat protein
MMLSKKVTGAVKFLLEHGARSDVKDEFGRTAFDAAKIQGHSDIIALLQGHGKSSD